mmetsp:Transcript_6440/g.15168  ORF Transcript_6440/g.15168 Transcript_6440/m.15168 type:complete len:201 (-) Transcript_6440:294-896(-)
MPRKRGTGSASLATCAAWGHWSCERVGRGGPERWAAGSNSPRFRRRVSPLRTERFTLRSSFRVQLVRFRSVGSCESLDIAVGMIDLPESGDVRAVLPIMKTCEVVELIEAPPGLIGLDCRYPMACSPSPLDGMATVFAASASGSCRMHGTPPPPAGRHAAVRKRTSGQRAKRARVHDGDGNELDPAAIPCHGSKPNVRAC